MDTETQRYVDKSMDTVKAQNDARFTEVLAGIEKVNANLSAHGAIVLARFGTVDTELKVVKDSSAKAEASADAAKSAVGGLKWNIFFTALGVVGVLLVTYQIWMQAIEMTTGLVK